MTFGVACSLMASFTLAVMDLISRVQADYAGNSVPPISPCSTWQRRSYAKRLMKFPARSWNGNIFPLPPTIETWTKTIPSEVRELWMQWQHDIASFAGLMEKKFTNCCRILIG